MRAQSLGFRIEGLGLIEGLVLTWPPWSYAILLGHSVSRAFFSIF